MRILKLLIGWPISLISIFFIGKFIFSRTSSFPSFKELNVPVLFFATICFFSYAILRAYLWKKILENEKYKLPFKNSLKHWVFSEFKRYTPGNIWSLVGRVLSFESLGVRKKDSAKALLYEAELVIVGGLLGSLLALPLIFNQLPDFGFEVIVQPLIFILIVLVCLTFIFAKRFNIRIFPKFNYKANTQLIFISVLSLLFFGVGSYLTTASLFYLDPRNVFILFGFYIFALLVGYLSLITPMGLGVREAVLFFGLSYFLIVPQTAVAVIFARIWFIVSELIFVLFVWLWSRSKSRFLLIIENYISNNKHLLALLLFVIIYVTYFANTSFLRHDNFFTGRFDLGNMDQTVWNTLHGRVFELTDPNGTNIISRLSFHADFMLILISPFYLIWKDPKMLLLIQTVILSLGSLFVFLIAKKIIKNKQSLRSNELNNFSLALALSYLINPAINYSNLFDFHSVVLSTTFLLAAFYFLITKRYIFLVVFLILSGLTKEQVWIVTPFFGIYLFFVQKKKFLGSIIFLLSIVFFYLLVFIAIPNLSGGKHFALSYYSDFGDSPLSIVKNFITDPVKTIAFIFQNGQLDYLKKIFYPFAFLPIFSPYIIFAFPDLFINIMSNNSQLHEIVYHYTAVITPFLFISTIYAIKKLREKTPNLKINFYAILILLFSLYSAYEFGPLPGAKYPYVEMYNNQLANNEEINRMLERIPKRYSISSTNNLGAHLSHRQKIYTVPLGMTEADIVLFLIRDPESNFAAKQESIWLLQVEKNNNFEKFAEFGQFTGFKKRNVRICFAKQALSFRNCPPYSR